MINVTCQGEQTRKKQSSRNKKIKALNVAQWGKNKSKCAAASSHVISVNLKPLEGNVQQNIITLIIG